MSDFSKALAIFGIVLPLNASALGIGEIRSHSALNQTLNAEIPLVLSGDESLDNIQVRLASPAAFERAGIERPHALAQLRFMPVAKPDGRYVIQVSSRSGIREPFLNFLVEVASPTGTLLREFTLLLDPPRGVLQATPGKSAAAYGGAAAPNQPWEEQRNGGYAPAYRPRPDYAASEPRPPSTPLRDPPAAPPAITPAQLTGQTYGPVQRGESLLDIASAVDRPPSITPYQMATALYLANPRAFSGNRHGLLAGSVLRLPTEDFIYSVNPEAARSASFDAAQGTPGNSPRAGYGYAGSRYPSGAAPAAPAQTAPPGGAGIAEVQALKKDNEELRERLSQLEQRLEETQRTHATLPGSPEPQGEPSAPFPIPDVTPIPATEEAPPVNPAAAATPTPPATPTEPAPVPAPVSAAEPKPAAPPPPATPPATAPKPAENEIPEEETTPLMQPEFWFISGGLSLAGLLAWLYRRRRNKADADDEPVTALVNPTESRLADNPSPPLGLGEPAFSLSAPALETPALDPLWEADVYLRYGRYPQAENLIREAIKQNPQQDDLKLKLFEIFSLAGNQDAFRRYAGELRAAEAELPPSFWLPVLALQPEWLPPELAAAIRQAAKDHPEPLPERAADAGPEPAATPEEPAELDLDDTDFADELRALEAQYADTLMTGQESAQAEPALAASPAGKPTSATAPPHVLDSGDDPSGLAQAAGLLAISDTDFDAELRALEAQSETQAALPKPESAEPAIEPPPLEADSGSGLEGHGLMDFLSPTPEVPLIAPETGVGVQQESPHPSMDSLALELGAELPDHPANAPANTASGELTLKDPALSPSLDMDDFGLESLESAQSGNPAMPSGLTLDENHGHASADNDASGFLDINDTDFTEELRALEAQYAHGSAEPSATLSAGQASDFGAVNAPAASLAQPQNSADPNSGPALTAGLAGRATSAFSGPADIELTLDDIAQDSTLNLDDFALESLGPDESEEHPVFTLHDGATDSAGLMDLNDTDFTEELRALEAQYAAASSADESLTLETPPQEKQPDNGYLLDFVLPTVEEIQKEVRAAKDADEPAITLDNFIAFEPGLAAESSHSTPEPALDPTPQSGN